MFRKAIPNENKENLKTIVNLMYEVLEISKDDFKHDSKQKVIAGLKYFFKLKANRWSYQFCYVKVIDNKVGGIAQIWDAKESQKIQNNSEKLWKKYFGREFIKVNEVSDGELYLYALSIDPHYQGQGIGKEFLTFVINMAKERKIPKIILYVEVEKPLVIKLYQKFGFKISDLNQGLLKMIWKSEL